MKTRSDLIAATLSLLNVLAAGQSPEAEDFDAIDGIIDGKLKELSLRSIVYIPNADELDDELVDPLSIILANTAAPSFGQPRNEESRLMAEAMLRSFLPSTYVTGSTLAVDYF
jgi:hypothetical protein